MSVWFWIGIGLIAWLTGPVLLFLVLRTVVRTLERRRGTGAPPRGMKVVDAAQLVAADLVDRLMAGFAAVYLLDDDGEPRLVASDGASVVAAARPPAVVFRALRARRFAPAAATELAELQEAGLTTPGAFATPLLVDRRPRGALLAAAPAHGWAEPVPRREAAFADVAAALLGLAAEAARHEEQARLDVLTGLPNRRAFEEEFDTLLRRGTAPVALAVLDLDGFKEINDDRGHLAGDKVLRRVARAMLEEVRAGERIFRIGGDEFALVVSGGPAAATAVLERLHARSRRWSGYAFSAGIALAPHHGQEREQLLRCADAALYAAKRAGGERSVLFKKDRAAAPPAAALAALGVLVVDDDPAFRELVRTTLELEHLAVVEAESAEAAMERLRGFRPSVIVLDVGMPRIDGITFCRDLKRDARTSAVPVILLSGLGSDLATRASAAGADAFLHKPFNPLELLGLIEELTRDTSMVPHFGSRSQTQPSTDFRGLVDAGLHQQAELRAAYRQTVTTLASALESKDAGTRAHSERVVAYAVDLTLAAAPALLDDPSLEYGFLLHDIGKIGVPERILQKPGRLTAEERRVVERHTVIGTDILAGVPLLAGEGIRVVRSHHERWEGGGYPDGLRHEQVPLGARVFAVADALDALTSDRPYRRAADWETAAETIRAEAGRQFDPAVVVAFDEVEEQLRAAHDAFTRAAAR